MIYTSGTFCCVLPRCVVLLFTLDSRSPVQMCLRLLSWFLGVNFTLCCFCIRRFHNYASSFFFKDFTHHCWKWLTTKQQSFNICWYFELQIATCQSKICKTSKNHWPKFHWPHTATVPNSSKTNPFGGMYHQDFSWYKKLAHEGWVKFVEGLLWLLDWDNSAPILDLCHCE